MNEDSEKDARSVNALFLDPLDDLLARGTAGLSRAFVETQVQFVAGQQEPDGGFHGLRGGSDLYYSDFALRTLCLLAPEHPALKKAVDYTSPDREGGGVAPATACRAASPGGLLDRLRAGPTPPPCLHAGLVISPHDIPAAFNLLNVNRLLTHCGYSLAVDSADVAGVVLEHLLPEGGFASTPHGGHVSAYQTFLGALCLQMLGLQLPLVEGAAQAVLKLQQADGGFAESPQQSSSQTNATAAAVAFLILTNSFPPERAPDTAAFLAGMQAEDGGILAHAEAAGADLMSTFTALVTLGALQAADRLDLAAVAKFLRSLAVAGGGFRAHHEDWEADVEYTYYGIGTLALLRLNANL